MTLYEFLSGAVTASFCIVGLFFLRFWKRTADPLFMTFAIAFWLLALAQAILALGGIAADERSWIYLIRLAAFLLIIFAIICKSRATRLP